MNAKVDKQSNRSPDFLMELGKLYFSNGLLDSAEEIFAKIPKEHDLYMDAAKFRIPILSQKQKYQEVVDLGEELINKGDHSTSVIPIILGAYYCLGQTAKVKSYLLKMAESVPETNEVWDELQSIKPLNDRPNIETLIKTTDMFLIPPHTTLDCIAPILWGGRPASCCFRDQLSLFALGDGDKKYYLQFASILYREFGIFTAYLPYIDLGDGKCVHYLLKLFFSLDPSLFERVENIKRLSWSELEKQEGESDHRRESLQEEGALLGYPTCCVEWALNNRRSGKSIENLALAASIEEEYACSLEPVNTALPEFAYFAFEFYPCDPRCMAAEEIGKDIFVNYNKAGTTLANFYRQHVLPLNKARIYALIIQYSDFTAGFNKTITEIVEISEFKETHPDFELYREDISAILVEQPDLESNPDRLSIAYEMAKKRASHRISAPNTMITPDISQPCCYHHLRTDPPPTEIRTH